MFAVWLGSPLGPLHAGNQHEHPGPSWSTTHTGTSVCRPVPAAGTGSGSPEPFPKGPRKIGANLVPQEIDTTPDALFTPLHTPGQGSGSCSPR